MRDAVLGLGLMVGLASVGCSLEDHRINEGEQAGAAGAGMGKTDTAGSSARGGDTSSGGAPDTTGPQTPDEGGSGAGGAGPETEGPTTCTEDEYDDGTGCQPLTICGDGEFEESPPKPDQDRVCAEAAQCAEGEYEKAPPTGAGNRECSPLTVCPAGTFIDAEPTAQSDRTCSPCPANTFSSTLNASECAAWSSCESGKTESVAPSSTSDRVCSSCGAGKYEAAGNCMPLTVCQGSQYEKTPATATSDRQCQAVTTCQPGSRQTAAATGTTDRQCAPCSAGTYSDDPNSASCTPWTRCGVNEYEADAPNSTQDRDCNSLTTCASGTHIKVAGTSTSDRLCEACNNGTFTSAPNVVSCQSWRNCSAGFRATAGSATQDRTCTECDDGTFSTTTNAAACKDWKVCTPNQSQTAAGTSTSDAVCVDCPTGSGRTCTSECPCASGVGVCTNSNQCASGSSCVADGGKKFGRSGNTCIVSHCDNDRKDSGETSVDCGGGCGCRASFEQVTYKGMPSGAIFNGLTGMSGDGSRFSGGYNLSAQGDGAPAAIDSDGNVTALERHGTSGGTTAISADGNVIIGRLGCSDPPQCSITDWSETRWVGSSGPERLYGSADGTITHTSASGALTLGFRYDEQAGGYRGFILNDNQVTNVPIEGGNNFFGFSRDGKYVGGFLPNGGAGLWHAPQQITPITNGNWDSVSIVAVTGTAPVVVGYGRVNSTNATTGYVWKGGNMTAFPPLPGGKSTEPFAVSVDGGAAVGSADDQAFIWTAGGGTRTILDELKARGYEAPGDLGLKNAFFISDDGKIIVGDDFLNTPMFWRVILD